MDPITAALIAKGVISGVKGIQGAIQAGKARRLEEDTMSKPMPRFQTPSEYYQLYKSAQRDKAMEAEIASAKEIKAANVEALSQVGSRGLLGGLNTTANAAQQSIADAARRGFEREQAALLNLANAQARTTFANTQADLTERANELNRARAGFQAGMETMYGGLEGVASSEILASDDDGGGTKTLQAAGKPVVPESPFGTEVKGVETPDFYNMANPFSQYMNRPKKENIDSVQYRDTFNTSGRPFGDDALFPFGTYVNNAKGGPITTKGEFDHDSNPLHVVDNNGQKVAEVTGQETLVYNPAQRKLMKKIMNRLINKGSVSLSQKEKEEAKNVLKAFQ